MTAKANALGHLCILFEWKLNRQLDIQVTVFFIFILLFIM